MFIVEFIALRLHCHLSTGSLLQRGTRRKSGKNPKCLTDTHFIQPPLYHVNLLHPQEEHQPKKRPLSISSSPPSSSSPPRKFHHLSVQGRWLVEVLQPLGEELPAGLAGSRQDHGALHVQQVSTPPPTFLIIDYSICLR